MLMENFYDRFKFKNCVDHFGVWKTGKLVIGLFGYSWNDTHTHTQN